MYPQNITVRLKFSVMIYANCGAIAITTSTTYMTISWSSLMNTPPPYPLR